MDIKAENIKEEDPLSEANSQTEKESFSQDTTMKLNNNATVFNKVDVSEMKIKTEIKEETIIPDSYPQDDAHFYSENTECNNYCEINTNIPIKEEACWQEECSPCVDETKDCADEILPSTGSLRLCRKEEEISRGDLVLSCDEYQGRNEKFSMRKDAPECEIARKYKSKEIDLSEISSMEIYAETHNDMEMESTSLCLKQKSTQLHDLDEKYCKSTLIGDYRCSEYKCNLCDKTFALASDFKKHKFQHQGKRPHKCDICEKNFAHFSHLKVHKLFHEGIKSHKCDICERGFTTLSNLNAHKPIHDGQRPHKCDICGKGFTRVSGLKIHKLKHESKRPHNCDACGKFFADLSSLKMHKLVHEGKMSYKCDTCGKCFSGWAGLRRHTFVHEDIKPYKCHLCGKGFTTFSNLKIHMAMHEDKRQHSCNICGRGFNQLSYVKKHMLTHKRKGTLKRDAR